MATSRLEQLLEFLKEDPADPFTLYAIAIEYTKTDQDKAREYFQTLLQEHENYVATYYHAAKLYAALGEKEEAARIFRKGLTISQQRGDKHAYRELLNAYNEFLYEEE